MTKLTAAQLRTLSPDVQIQGDHPPPSMDAAERAKQQYKPRQAKTTAVQMAAKRRAMTADERRRIIWRAAIRHQAMPALSDEFWQPAGPEMAGLAAQCRELLEVMMERLQI